MRSDNGNLPTAPLPSHMRSAYAHSSFLAFCLPVHHLARYTKPLGALAILVLCSVACDDGEHTNNGSCSDCPPAADVAARVDVAGTAIPWRNQPAAHSLEPRLIDGKLHWAMPSGLGQDLVEVIVEAGGELLIAARLQSPPYEPEPGMTPVGVRPVRGERVGPIHRLSDTAEATSALQLEGSSKPARLLSILSRLAPGGSASNKRASTSPEPVHAVRANEKATDGPDSHAKRPAALDDPLTLRRLSHSHHTCLFDAAVTSTLTEDMSCRHSHVRGAAEHKKLATKQNPTWGLVSVDAHLAPSASGLEAWADLTLEAPGEVDTLTLALNAENVDGLETTPGHESAALQGEALTITFDSPPSTGSSVDVSFAYSIQSFEDAGLHPADAGIGLDPSTGEARLFFFTGRSRLLPAPQGALSVNMPLTLTLDVPEGWTTASNLVRGEGGEWLGRDLGRRHRPVLASGAYTTASSTTESGLLIRTMALADENGAVADLDDYAASHAATLDVYRTWGELTQSEVAVAAVSSEHGGSAVYGLVLTPDYIYQRSRSRGRDFFLAHELSHQWWGSVVWAASDLDLWLTEGLADYSALRAVEVLRGPQDADAVWDENLELLIYLMAEGYGGRPGRDVPVRPEAASELQDYVYYLKGSWVLRRLEVLIGREAIDHALAAYYEAAIHATASTGDFITAVHEQAGGELGWFWRQWLSGTGLPEIVFAPYFHPDDPTDFEIVITQIGDEPHPSEAWRLAIQLTVGDETRWVCMTEKVQAFVAADLSSSGPLEVCGPR